MLCRTCLGTLELSSSLRLTKRLSVGKSVEEILLFFIPEMVQSKVVDYFVCSDCVDTIQIFIKFIEMCITAENYLRREDNIWKQLQDTSKGTTKGKTSHSVKKKSYSSKSNKLKEMKFNQRNSDALKLIPILHLPPQLNKENDNSVKIEELEQSRNESSYSFVKPIKTYSKARKPLPVSNEKDPNFVEASDGKNTEHLPILIDSKNLGKTKQSSQTIDLKDTTEHNQIDCNSPGIPEENSSVTCSIKSQIVVDVVEHNNQTDCNSGDIPEENSSVTYSSNFLDNPLMKTFYLSPHVDNISVRYNRAIRLTKTNKEIDDFLSSFPKNDFNLMKLDKLRDSGGKRILFLGHILAEKPNSPFFYKCPACREYFNTKRMLDNHLSKIHKDYYHFQCEKCGKRFKREFSYKKHLQDFKLFQECRRMRVCPICKETMPVYAYSNHLQSHGPIQCNICNKRLLSPLNLHKHRLRHQNGDLKNPQLRELCPICGKLLTAGGIRYHLKSHSQNRNYLCEQCPTVFKTRATLQKHKNVVHNRSQTCECHICKKILTSKASMLLHMKLKHLKMFSKTCSICGKGFCRNDYYIRHMRRHTMFGVNVKKYRSADGKNFGCKYCKKAYKSVQLLRTHISQSHVKNIARPVCRICNMSFRDASSRNRHEKRHQNPKAFELTCKVCWNRFSSKEKLEVHLLKHKGSQRRKCEHCGEAFPSKYLLFHHRAEKHSSIYNYITEEKRNALLDEALSDFILK